MVVMIVMIMNTIVLMMTMMTMVEVLIIVLEHMMMIHDGRITLFFNIFMTIKQYVYDNIKQSIDPKLDIIYIYIPISIEFLTSLINDCYDDIIQSIDLMNRRERRKNKHLLVTTGSINGSISAGSSVSWKPNDRVPTEVIHQQMADMKR
jgi:hypothetical protein